MRRVFLIGGMSCAACSAHVQHAAERVAGVTSAEVNLLTAKMVVEGDAPTDAIVAAVKAAGYTARLDDGKRTDPAAAAKKLRLRFLLSLVFWLPLLYLAMGHMIGLPLPPFLETPLAQVIAQTVLVAPIVGINYAYFVSGAKALFRRAPNMDTLVALGATAALGYGLYTLVAIAVATAHGDEASAHALVMNLYFEGAGTILTLITLGKWLEGLSKGKTTQAIRSLVALTPATATRLTDGGEETVALGDVRIGDRLIVRPGESIGVDGTVADGAGTVNESMFSGESLPVDKRPGDKVFAGTVNTAGAFVYTAEKIGADTMLSSVVRLMEEASSSKAPISRIADKVSGIFVPVVIGIALVAFAVWMILGYGVAFALNIAISVLVISCPCALGLATPVAIMVGTGKGAEQGILIKSAEALETLGKCDIVVLDKTGTITRGEPRVTDIVCADGVDETRALLLAGSLEAMSEHPLGRAVTACARERGLRLLPVGEFSSLAGEGVEGVVDSVGLQCGKRVWLERCGIDCTPLDARVAALRTSGKTEIRLADGNKLLAVFLLADTLKPEAPAAVAQLGKLGCRLVMLTGDNAAAAQAVADRVGIPEVRADVRPDQKDAVVRELQREGKVVMVGDGINDAPALMRADVGVAIGAGTDIAIESADVVLVKDDLTALVGSIRLSRATLRNIKQNLFWAFLYNSIGIPLAAGVLYALDVLLNPMIASAAMSLSSVCVVCNALRLRLFRPLPRAERSDVPPAAPPEAQQTGPKEGQHYDGAQAPEGDDMKLELTIEGMMCDHCKHHVEDAIKALGASVKVDLKSGTAVVKGKDLDADALSAAVKAAGYTVTAVREL